eukprot:10969049-Alexandrium_andersonii.AAC.1
MPQEEVREPRDEVHLRSCAGTPGRGPPCRSALSSRSRAIRCTPSGSKRSRNSRMGFCSER